MGRLAVVPDAGLQGCFVWYAKQSRKPRFRVVCRPISDQARPCTGLFLLGRAAVLVAGSGLIIRLRKDTVGSNPTPPTKPGKGTSRSSLCRAESVVMQRVPISHCR